MPRVRRILEQLGHEVIIDDLREFGDNLAMKLTALKLLTGRDHAAVEAVSQNPSGQIEVADFDHMIRLMVSIIDVFPSAKVVVPTATRRRAKAMAIAAAR